jgi:hypothetical protein
MRVLVVSVIFLGRLGDRKFTHGVWKAVRKHELNPNVRRGGTAAYSARAINRAKSMSLYGDIALQNDCAQNGRMVI